MLKLLFYFETSKFLDFICLFSFDNYSFQFLIKIWSVLGERTFDPIFCLKLFVFSFLTLLRSVKLPLYCHKFNFYSHFCYTKLPFNLLFSIIYILSLAKVFSLLSLFTNSISLWTIESLSTIFLLCDDTDEWDLFDLTKLLLFDICLNSRTFSSWWIYFKGILYISLFYNNIRNH